MSEFEQYIPTITKLGLTRISDRDISDIRRIYGRNILEVATSREVESAYNYLHGPVKEKVEKILATVFLKCGGELLIKRSSEKIQKFNGGADIFYLKTGFPGLVVENGQGYIYEPKIRTMRPGADKERGHFEHTSFVGVTEDGRVLPGAEFLRKSGIDELPQFRLVALGRMSLIGPRAYSDEEIKDTEILFVLKDNTKSGFSEEVKWILENYRSVLRQAELRQGILSLMSGYNSKNTPHMVRMWLDMIYAQKATPFLDFLIVYNTAVRRQIKGIGTG